VAASPRAGHARRAATRRHAARARWSSDDRTRAL